MSGQDERITAAAKRARTTIAFFASVIKSGEQWTLACENEMEQTLAALDASDAVEAREVAALTAECERLRAVLCALVEALECSPVWSDWQTAPEVLEAQSAIVQAPAAQEET